MISLKKFHFLLIAPFLLLGSCLGPREYSPINNYDLGKARQTGIRLNISTIDQNGPYNSRMIFRVTPEKVDINEYQRWTRSPDLVLNDYFKGSFIPGGNYFLEGEIIAFENDLVSNKAVFTFYYKITDNGNSVAEGLFEGIEDSSGNASEYAAAMAKLARDLIQEISLKMQKISTQ